jgi:hypothetical protein
MMPVPTAAGTPKGGSSLKDRLVFDTSVSTLVVVASGTEIEVSGTVVAVVDGAEVRGTVDEDVGSVVVVSDDSLLLVVVAVFAVVVTGTVEEVEVAKGPVVVLAKIVVVGLGMVVGTDVTDEGKVVVVSDGGTPVVDTAIVVVGQCWFGLLELWHWSCWA